MIDWQEMFRGVQTIAQSAESFEQGMSQTIALARSDKRKYDEPAYWDLVERSASQLPTSAVVGWAREGLESLDRAADWDFVLLDLGDCPEVFDLYGLGCRAAFVEDRFRGLVLSTSVIEFHEFEECFAADVSDPESELYDCERLEWVYHNVRELEHDILSWNMDSVDFHGNNGYLLWLALGSLALAAPLKDQDYCRAILRGRSRLYLMPGFEEIFFYLATVTPQGLSFEVEGETT